MTGKLLTNGQRWPPHCSRGGCTSTPPPTSNKTTEGTTTATALRAPASTGHLYNNQDRGCYNDQRGYAPYGTFLVYRFTLMESLISASLTPSRRGPGYSTSPLIQCQPRRFNSTKSKKNLQKGPSVESPKTRENDSNSSRKDLKLW